MKCVASITLASIATICAQIVSLYNLHKQIMTFEAHWRKGGGVGGGLEFRAFYLHAETRDAIRDA